MLVGAVESIEKLFLFLFKKDSWVVIGKVILQYEYILLVVDLWILPLFKVFLVKFKMVVSLYSFPIFP